MSNASFAYARSGTGLDPPCDQQDDSGDARREEEQADRDFDLRQRTTAGNGPPHEHEYRSPAAEAEELAFHPGTNLGRGEKVQRKTENDACDRTREGDGSDNVHLHAFEGGDMPRR